MTELLFWTALIIVSLCLCITSASIACLTWVELKEERRMKKAKNDVLLCLKESSSRVFKPITEHTDISGIEEVYDWDNEYAN